MDHSILHQLYYLPTSPSCPGPHFACAARRTAAAAVTAKAAATRLTASGDGNYGDVLWETHQHFKIFKAANHLHC